MKPALTRLQLTCPSNNDIRDTIARNMLAAIIVTQNEATRENLLHLGRHSAAVLVAVCMLYG